MKIHRLKTWPVHFADVYNRRKKQEIRLNDRDFRTGDLLILLEFDPDTLKYSGTGMIRRVTHVLREHDGLKPEFVIMSIREISGATGVCQLCRCIENNCHQCIEKTGEPCSWVNEEETLCSACAFEGIEEVSHG